MLIFPRSSLLLVLLLAGCGRSPPAPPAPTPLDDLAAKPAEVRSQVEDTQREHMDELKRQEAAATGADDAQPRR